MSLVKTVLACVLGVVLLSVTTLLIITQLIDPNDFKPELEMLAKNHGLPVKIPGQVSWQWYPYLGLSIDGIEVGEEPIFTVEYLAARVALKPLLHRKVIVKDIEVAGVQLNLHTDKEGRANWQSLLPTEDKQQAAANIRSASANEPVGLRNPELEASAEKSLEIAAEQIKFERFTISYRDLTSDTHIKVDDLAMLVENFEVTGRRFHLEHSGRITLNHQPEVEFIGRGELGFSLHEKTLYIDPMMIRVRDPGAVRGSDIELTVKGQLNTNSSVSSLSMSVKPFDLRPWLAGFAIELPPMSAKDAFSIVGVSSDIKGDLNGWVLNNLQLQLDQSRLTGSVSISSTEEIEVSLNVDRLNLDRYLPENDPAAKTETVSNQAVTVEAPIDFSDLQSIKAALLLKVQELQVAKLQFTDAALDVKALSGLITVSRFQSGFYQGTLAASGSIDTRKSDASIRAQGDLLAVAVKPVLQVVADESQLSGIMNAKWSLSTSGNTALGWRNKLTSSAVISAKQMALEGIDVERTACELAALVNSKPSPELAWKGLTSLRDLDATVSMQGDKLTIQQLQAGVENLDVKAQGTMDLDTGEFEFPLSVAFVGGETDANRKCSVRERWQQKPLPIRCKGAFTSLSARTCLPDRKRLDDLLRDELKGRAQEKLKTTIEKKLGTEPGAAVEELFKGLLRR